MRVHFQVVFPYFSVTLNAYIVIIYPILCSTRVVCGSITSLLRYIMKKLKKLGKISNALVEQAGFNIFSPIICQIYEASQNES